MRNNKKNTKLIAIYTNNNQFCTEDWVFGIVVDWVYSVT